MVLWGGPSGISEQILAALKEKPREWLEVACAEWKGGTAASCHPSLIYNVAEYEKALAEARLQTPDWLARYVHRRSEHQGLWEKHGETAWCCPFGCHLVTIEKEV